MPATIVAVILLATGPAMAIAETRLPLDSAAIDALWDYDQPAASEARFRTLLATAAPGSPERLELLTQVARAQGLQRQFAQADATLDEVERALAGQPARIEIRYLLERGRVLNSSGQKESALPLFEAALAAGRAAQEDFLAIDAAHMIAIAAPPEDRLKRNLEALALAGRTADSRAKKWLGSLYNNIGWNYHDRGDYATALGYFEKALTEREARGDSQSIRVARWCVARALRSLKRYDDALAIQQALLAEYEKVGGGDGYVYEELGELALARRDAAAAPPWFAKAYAALSTDPWLVANEPARLARLRELGGVR